MNNALSWSLDQPWFIWATCTVLLFPLLIVGLGELISRLEVAHSPWSTPLKHLRHLVLPQLVFLIILTRVLLLPKEDVWVRVVETALWIFVIHTTLAILNTIIFGRLDDQSGHWSARIPKLVVDFARAILVIIGASLVLSSVWGVELGRMMAALGVGSVVLGLALQDTLGSLFSGITLLSARQFRVGDWLRVGDQEQGKIIDMNWRSVTLLTRDEDVIVVPNSELAKGRFMNFSYPYPRHRERVQFDLSFDDPPYKVKNILSQAALATPGILAEPPPRVVLVSYDEFSVKHEVQYFIDAFQDQPRILDDYKSRIWYVAKRHGISFPTRAHEVQLSQPQTTSPETNQQIIHTILAAQPLLRERPEIVAQLAGDASLLDYASGENITSQYSMSDALYLVHLGQVLESYTDTNGQTHPLKTLSTHDFFGLTALVRRAHNDATTLCIGDVQVIAVDASAIHRVLEQSPELATEMEQLIEARARAIAVIERESRKKQRAIEQPKDGDRETNTLNIQSFLDW